MTNFATSLSLDMLDRRLLRAVQTDCSASMAALAERCASTEATVRRRLKRLVAAGVVERPAMRVAPERVGLQVQVILSMRLEKETPEQFERFRAAVVRHPAVSACYFVTGTWDYVLILNLPGMPAFDEFLQEVVLGHPVVVATETRVVIRALKAGGPVPIAEPGEAFTGDPADRAPRARGRGLF
jgi:Lrp/AsnC family leucine-responsive transcriptional regulator